MPIFGTESQRQLATCDARLQRVLREAIQYFDFSVLEGHRGQAAQEAAYRTGASKVHWPYGNHNTTPSRAADCAPYPLDWSSKTTAIARFAFMHGVIWVCARRQGVRVRFGFDWNRNLDPRDETFLDWGHVELDEP
jgi:peptidoglycan L-alanyl-D-glutamate endopeptidase CwlK